MTVAGDAYHLVFCPEGELLERTRACEADVFLEVYGNTELEWVEEYGPYEDASHFIALVGACGEVVGSCRLIVPSPVGLKTVNDLGRAPWKVDGARAVRAAGADLSQLWDVATLAVRKDGKVTPLASAALYHGLVQAMRANGVRWIVMMLDERVRRLLAVAGVMLRPIPGTSPAPYLGSVATAPLVGDLPAMAEAQRRQNPDGYRLLSMGAGLTGIAVPPLSEWVISTWGRVPVHGGGPGLARTA
jgi:hypothetical protein